MIKRLMRICIAGAFFSLCASTVLAVSEFDRNWGVVDQGSQESYTPYSSDLPIDQEDITLDADDSTYDSSNKVFRAVGNVEIRYQDAIFYADEVIYDDVNKIAEAVGWSRLEYERPGGQKYTLIGEHGIFNIENQAGQFENAHIIVNFGPFQSKGRWFERKWYVYGDKITKDANEYIFHVEDGKATTCPPEYKSPLYSIEAKRMTVFAPQGDQINNKPRISARNLFLKFEGVPILWLPQLTYTITEDEYESPVQIASGYGDEKGGYVELSLDIFKNQYLTLTPHFGYYSEHGFSGGLDGNYQYEAPGVTKLSGKWKTFFLEDISRTFTQQRDKDHEEGDNMFRYRFLWQHCQTFGPGAGWLNKGVLTWQVDWMSDPDIMYEFYYDDYTEYGPRDTYLDFTRPIGKDNEVSIYLVKQVNDFYSTYERLPELRHVFRKRRIMTIPTMNVPVYYESKSQAGYYHFIENEDIPDHTSYSVWRAFTDHKLSAPKRYFNFLNVNPFVGLSAEFGDITQYTVGKNYNVNSKGKVKSWTERRPAGFWNLDYDPVTRSGLTAYMPQEEGAYFRAVPYTGIDLNFKMFRTYNFEGTYAGEMLRKYLSSDNEKIRHVLEPQAHILAAYGVGNNSGGALAADIGLRNAFQIERRGQNVNLLDITMMFSQRFYNGMFEAPVERIKYTYNPKTKEEFQTYQAQTLMGFDLKAKPFEWLALESDLVWNLYDLSNLSRATLNSDIDITWALQKLMASTYMPRNLRGRKDQASVYLGYRYLNDYANQVTVGTRVWFDDFTPLLSLRQQQKSWMRELARGWGAEFNMRYEAESGTLQEAEYTVMKNWKKCLDTSVSYRNRDDDHSIYATFWLTAYPNSKIDLGN